MHDGYDSMRGSVIATIAPYRGQARCASLRESVPLRLIGPSHGTGGASGFFLLNTSGAVIGGDHLTTRITVERGTALSIRTPGSTLLHPGGHTHLIEHLSLAPDCYVEWLPGSFIPYAGAYIDHHWTANVHTGATLIVADHFLAGRLARGEAFQFTALRSLRRITYGSWPLYVEAQSLVPCRGQLSGWGPYTCQATLIVAGPHATVALADELAALFEAPGSVPSPGDLHGNVGQESWQDVADGQSRARGTPPASCQPSVVWGSASTLARNGVIARLLTTDPYESRRRLDLAIAVARRHVLLGSNTLVRSSTTPK